MTILNRVNKWMEADGWQIQRLPDQDGLISSCTTDNGEFRCHLVTNEELGVLCFYTVPTVSLAEERRFPMMELLTRINFDLLLGNFEIDLDDGYIRFKSSFDVEEIDIDNEE